MTSSWTHEVCAGLGSVSEFTRRGRDTWLGCVLVCMQGAGSRTVGLGHLVERGRIDGRTYTGDASRLDITGF